MVVKGMHKENAILTLDKIKMGEHFLITEFFDPQVKCMSARLGVGEGQILKCIYHTTHGPIVLQKKSQEIALGNELTKDIAIQLV